MSRLSRRDALNLPHRNQRATVDHQRPNHALTAHTTNPTNPNRFTAATTTGLGSSRSGFPHTLAAPIGATEGAVAMSCPRFAVVVSMVALKGLPDAVA